MAGVHQDAAVGQALAGMAHGIWDARDEKATRAAGLTSVRDWIRLRTQECCSPRQVQTGRMPMNLCRDTAMTHLYPPPDQAMADHPLAYSDPELRAYAEEQAEDILESVVHYMPLLLPCMGALLIFMLAFIAVVMA